MIDTKVLRQKILDLAMRGKLVPQDSNDEPVENLLARIKEERHRLEKEKKISKVVDSDIFWSDDDNCYYEKLKNNEDVVDDIPYDTPNNWVWCRFGSLVNIQTGATFNKEVAITNEKSNYIRVLRGGNISPFKWTEKYDDLFIPRDLVKDNILLSLGDIITPAVTSLENVGKFGLVESLLSKEITVGGFVFLIRPHLIDQILSKYIFYVLSSDELINSIKNITKKSGSAFYNINKEAFKNLLFSLPPLQEQQRIVTKLDELFALIDKIEKEQEELEDYKKLAKEKVLELAVTGKLVKQDPNDEPASMLLERIKKEKEALIKAGKIKKDRTDNEPLSDDDKNYYGNLPNGWCFARLSDLALYKKGPFGSSLTKDMFVDSSTTNRIKVYEQKNAIKHSCSLGNYYISLDRFQLLKAFEICPLDYIVSCAGTIGEIYKMPAKIEKGIINQALMKITLINENISIMFEIILFVALRALSGSSKGTAIKNIAPFDKLKPYLIKLPPLPEQTRIMKRFNTVQKLLDNC